MASKPLNNSRWLSKTLKQDVFPCSNLRQDLISITAMFSDKTVLLPLIPCDYDYVDSNSSLAEICPPCRSPPNVSANNCPFIHSCSTVELIHLLLVYEWPASWLEITIAPISSVGAETVLDEL